MSRSILSQIEAERAAALSGKLQKIFIHNDGFIERGKRGSIEMKLDMTVHMMHSVYKHIQSRHHN